MWRVIVAFLLLSTLAIIGYAQRDRLAALLPTAQPAHHTSTRTLDEAAFEQWYAANPVRRAQIDAFFAFLAAHGVADVLDQRSLLITDRRSISPTCQSDAFALPPRSKWPQIVPTLAYIRAHVVPAVGPVQVISGYRTPEANQCSGGAKQSAHLSFSALDLVPLDQKQDRDEFFTKLCAMWAASPRALGAGLGAYYDGNPAHSTNLRFHIDTKGHRTWGFSFKTASSYCMTHRN